MTIAIWISAAILLTGYGLVTWRVPIVARMDLPSRLAIAFAAGNVFAGVVMYAESLAGISWTRASVAVPLAVAIAIAVVWRRGQGMAARPGVSVPLLEWIPLALIVLLAVYGAATARITCADLLYFWGPKAEKFFFAQRIDVEFLGFPHYYLMHPDYPPLQPLAYVWSSLAAHRFSLWGAVLLTPLYLLAAALAFRGFAGPVIGVRRATAFAALLSALLAFGFTAGRAAGAADPLLLLFEVIALSAFTFSHDAGAYAIGSMALAGAVFTKVEGTAFAVIVIVAFLITTRRFRAALAIALPPALLIGSWIAFAKHNGLLDSYKRGDTPLHLDSLGYVAYMTGWKAAYRVYWLPWIASLGGLTIGVNWRRAALPLLAGAASIAATLFFYLHEPEPLWWIQASAERVLLTPLAAFVVATAAASE